MNLAPKQKTHPHGLTDLLRRLWSRIQPGRRRQFIILLLMMVVASFAELASISAVLPFLAVLTSPEIVFNHPTFQPIITFLGIREANSLIVPFTLAFIVGILTAAAIRISILRISTNLSFLLGADLGLDIYRRTLYQPYSVHIKRNSSVIIDAVSNKSQSIIHGVILPLTTIVSSLSITLVLLIALIIYKPLIALPTIVAFGTVYIMISWISRELVQRNSKLIASFGTRRLKSLQEGMSAIRDLLLDGSQQIYCDIFAESDKKLRIAQAQNAIIAQSPRYFIEAIGLVLIALLSLWLALQPNGIMSALPLMGALALTAQRLLPMLQHLYQSWTTLKGHQWTLIEVLDLLDQPLPCQLTSEEHLPLKFQQHIMLENVEFKYSENSLPVFSGVNMRIPKGSRVGFVGATGCGKSTLLDLIMALLQPTKGVLSVDGVEIDANNARAWQNHISHVPQAIYLADADVAQNIAFGESEDQIDMDRVKKAAIRAQLAKDIESWPHGYGTPVGERGVQLSGGQRQRIGIARALYKSADVIVLDEATSALDAVTESAVMEAIEDLDKSVTILIIAHRLTTLKDCDIIVNLSQGSVTAESVSHRKNGDGASAIL